jgi:cytochrome c oxidase assembly protein subunit 15
LPAPPRPGPARPWPWVRRLALAALVSLLVLIFAGATVRVTGAGLGCPDWPTCWGCLVPPWNKEQVDLGRIDFERFRRKAEQLGRDPQSVSPARILDRFNPVHTWTEFINRLAALPVALFTLATFAAASLQRPRRPTVFAAAFGSLLLVFFNAWLGARVVYSGLQPGIITLHMGAAMALVVLLTFTAWRSGDPPWRIRLAGPAAGPARLALGLLFALTLTEGFLGSGVREITDHLQHGHHGAPRGDWLGELERSSIYVIHRSFSWLILVAAASHFVLARRARSAGAGPLERAILGLVLAQMALGLVMSRFAIHPAAQLLHVGFAAVLLSCQSLWLLAARRVAGVGP